MERKRNTEDGQVQGMINDGLFGPGAVGTASFVEPLERTPRRVNLAQARETMAGRGVRHSSVSRYLTPLAAFGAAAAMAFGMSVGGNLLLNHGDQIAALLYGTDDQPLVAERAFAGAVATLRASRPRPVQKSKTAETPLIEHPAEIEVISRDASSELPDEISDAPSPQQREPARNDREARFRDLEKIRDRQQKNLKEFLESSDEFADN